MIVYHIDVPRRLVTTRLAGRFSETEMLQHLLRIARDPKFEKDFNGLIVVADVAAVPTGPVVELLKPIVRTWSRRREGARWGFVLPTRETLEFVESGLVRLALTSVSTRCFLAESAALAWLLAADPVTESATMV
jgi:hypothetical protein